MTDKNQELTKSEPATPVAPTAPILDTRGATKNHPFYLIVENGTPEGKTLEFNVRPMDSAAYLRIMSLRDKIQALRSKDPTDKQVKQMADELDKLLIPLIVPNKEFTEWVKKTLDNGAYVAYRTVMDTVIEIGIPRMQVKANDGTEQ